jgi:hypothetical protein
MKHFILSLSIAALTALYADYTVVLQTGDEQQVFQYKDDRHASITMGEENKLMVIGDKAYMITNRGGEKIAMDVDQMRSMMGTVGVNVQDEIKKAKDDLNIKIIKKGKTQKIAGVKGRVWTVEYTENGRKERSDVLVTKQRDIVKAMEAYSRILGRMAGDEDEDIMDFIQIKPGHVVIATLDEKDGFRLKKFHEKKIPASTFELSKDVRIQQMPDFGKLFGGQ